MNRESPDHDFVRAAPRKCGRGKTCRGLWPRGGLAKLSCVWLSMSYSGKYRTALYLRWVGLIALVIIWLVSPDREPRYQGKTLTAWLYNPDPDFVGMPNDVYGHIHNELWETLLAGGYAAREKQTNQFMFTGPGLEPDPGTVATLKIGTNAIPRLLKLMASRPGMGERFRAAVGPRLPSRVSLFLFRTPLIRTAERYRYAACKGFEALGTNAASALPALSELLKLPEADFELGLAISAVGVGGREVLVNALTNRDEQSRRVAAFCLGLDPGAQDSACPALLSLVDRDQANYQVLGALGRLGGSPHMVIPVLTRFLERRNELGVAGFETELAILILGLYGEKAEPAVPVLVSLYGPADKTTRQVIRVVINHIQPEDFQRLLGRPPGAKDNEDPWWGGAQD